MSTPAPAIAVASSSTPRPSYRLPMRRTFKLQVALTPEERALIAERALQSGYDSSSSYVRAVALASRSSNK